MPTRERTHPSRRPPSTFGRDEEPERGADPGQLWLALFLGFLAIILSAGALAISLLRAGSSGSACQTLAWDSIPDSADLPEGWAVTTSNFFVGSMTATVDGPLAGDAESAGGLLATVTCYGGDGAEALARSRAAEAASGNTIEDLDLGDAGFDVGTPDAGTTAIHFLRNGLVADLAVSGTVDEVDLHAVAEAFDLAMQKADGGPAPTVAAGGEDLPPPDEEPPSDELPLESDLPAESPVAPELEAMLPTEINGTTFLANSATGVELPPDQPATRALMASLRSLDFTAEDLQIAEAYDENDELDLYLLAFRLPGGDGTALRDILLESWMSANAAGVTQEAVSLSGRELIRVSYGDEASDTYVFTREDAVILIHTSDNALAEATAAALPE